MKRTAALLGALALLLLLLSPSGAERPKCMGERATIVGTNGTERIVGTNGKDVIVAKGGSDYIVARASGDLVCAGTGRDHIETGDGPDRVRAGGGNDYLVGGNRTRLLDGSTGTDVFFTGGGMGGEIRGGPDSDWLSFVDRHCAKPAKVSIDDHEARYRNCAGTKTRVWRLSGIENVEGGRGSDVLIGGDSRDRLFGHEGRDRLEGFEGRDLLHGGPRTDTAFGGRNRDTCISVERRHSCGETKAAPRRTPLSELVRFYGLGRYTGSGSIENDFLCPLLPLELTCGSSDTNSATRSRASPSVYCTGGDFMK
jgi:hypothetical protein